ncbi:MFS transporter [Prescottella equi]
MEGPDRPPLPASPSRWWSHLLRERPRPQVLRERPGAWRLAVAAVCFGAFMGQLDASIVTLTYVQLGEEFDAPLAAVEWVSLAYLLTLVSMLVPVGRLADAHGRKQFYLYGFVVFTAASAACGLAPSLGALIAFRVVQAVGAALLQANSVALVTTSAPESRMRAALGVQAAAQGLGLALGPTIGGVLVATAGWRWVFGINVPVGVLALIVGYYVLPRTRARTPVDTFDWAGLILLIIATTSGLLGISAVSGSMPSVWAVTALFVLAVVASAGFGLRQLRAKAPLIDLSLVRRPAVFVGLAGALCAYLVLFGPLVLVPLVLAGHGESELTAGLVLTALPAGFAVAATMGDAVLPRALTDRGRCLVGGVVCVAALAPLLAVPLTAMSLAPLLGVLGLGLGVFTPANNAMVMGAVPARASGTGGGLVNMARGLGTALGIAFVTLAFRGEADGARIAVGVLLAVAALTTFLALASPTAVASKDPRGTV